MPEEPQEIRVLYLSRWYPNRYDPMPGLFIKRHAEAARKFCSVGVVYTHVVDREKIKGFQTELKNINGVFTACVYYNNPGVRIPLMTTLIKAARFLRANAIGIRKIQDELGGVDLLHIHILTRLGLIALWYKWVRRKPYVVSEHWSRYLPATDEFRGMARKWLTRLVVKNASVVTTVTQNLADAMQEHGLAHDDYRVLPNVVPNEFVEYRFAPDHGKKKATLVHVSCFEDKSKNISGLLRVIKSLSLSRRDFQFKMIGDGMDYNLMTAYAAKLGISNDILLFTGLMEGKPLVREMASADLLVVFSNYENFPVVINEGFVLGVPVIATRVGGIPEFVNRENGIIVPAGDESSLEKEINRFLDGNISFNRKRIRSAAVRRYDMHTVGSNLYDIYRKVVQS